MNDIQGYCHIKKSATTCHGAKFPEQFIAQTCKVMEFAKDGGVLALNPECTALAMFDACDIKSKFECNEQGIYIFPANLNMIEQMAYINKLTSRKGGWAPILKQMVIQASLHRGKYTDDFLFQMEREEKMGMSFKSEL
jgi:hypothetical protein